MTPPRFWCRIQTHKVFHGALGRAEHHGRRVVGHLPLGLGVHSDEVEFIPPTPSELAMSRKTAMEEGLVGEPYMASISSSTFHPCSELMGTELGMR